MNSQGIRNDAFYLLHDIRTDTSILSAMQLGVSAICRGRQSSQAYAYADSGITRKAVSESSREQYHRQV